MSTQHWFRRMVVLVPTFTPKPPSEEAKSAAQVQMAAVRTPMSGAWRIENPNEATIGAIA